MLLLTTTGLKDWNISIFIEAPSLGDCQPRLKSASSARESKTIPRHKFDIIFISETYLDSNTSPDDNNWDIFGYNLIRPGHPSRNKRGGICIYQYHKHSLHWIILNVQYLQECLNSEMKIG